MKIGVEFEETNQTFDMSMDGVVVLPGNEQNGATFIPHISEDGVLSWTNDKELPNPEPVNIKGERGLQGVPGEKGEKGDPGEQGIPGEKGDTGADGKDGADGYTPVKGEDYYTEAEKTELVNEVIASVSEGVYGTTPIFETTTSEAVELLEINQKADGTPFRLKAFLLFVEATESGGTMYWRGMLNGYEKMSLPIGSIKANAYAMSEAYVSRGRWDAWRQAFDANKYNSAYRYGPSFTLKQVDVKNVPWLDAVRITNIPANTKVILYGVEENA